MESNIRACEEDSTCSHLLLCLIFFEQQLPCFLPPAPRLTYLGALLDAEDPVRACFGHFQTLLLGAEVLASLYFTNKESAAPKSAQVCRSSGMQWRKAVGIQLLVIWRCHVVWISLALGIVLGA